jgi:hypothetical protein
MSSHHDVWQLMFAWQVYNRHTPVAARTHVCTRACTAFRSSFAATRYVDAACETDDTSTHVFVCHVSGRCHVCSRAACDSLVRTDAWTCGITGRAFHDDDVVHHQDERGNDAAHASAGVTSTAGISLASDDFHCTANPACKPIDLHAYASRHTSRLLRAASIAPRTTVGSSSGSGTTAATRDVSWTHRNVARSTFDRAMQAQVHRFRTPVAFARLIAQRETGTCALDTARTAGLEHLYGGTSRDACLIAYRAWRHAHDPMRALMSSSSSSSSSPPPPSSSSSSSATSLFFQHARLFSDTCLPQSSSAVAASKTASGTPRKRRNAKLDRPRKPRKKKVSVVSSPGEPTATPAAVVTQMPLASIPVALVSRRHHHRRCPTPLRHHQCHDATPMEVDDAAATEVEAVEAEADADGDTYNVVDVEMRIDDAVEQEAHEEENTTAVDAMMMSECREVAHAVPAPAPAPAPVPVPVRRTDLTSTIGRLAYLQAVREELASGARTASLELTMHVINIVSLLAIKGKQGRRSEHSAQLIAAVPPSPFDADVERTAMHGRVGRCVWRAWSWLERHAYLFAAQWTTYTFFAHIGYQLYAHADETRARTHYLEWIGADDDDDDDDELRTGAFVGGLRACLTYEPTTLAKNGFGKREMQHHERLLKAMRTAACAQRT